MPRGYTVHPQGGHRPLTNEEVRQQGKSYHDYQVQMNHPEQVPQWPHNEQGAVRSNTELG